MTEIVDFFFSPYKTAQQRRMSAALADGLAHGSRIEPADPLPGQTVALLFSVNARVPLERVAVYYTIDGTEPLGARGQVAHGEMVLAERVEDQVAEQETYQWRAVLPGQQEGVLVRYRADGWSVSAPEVQRYADSVDPVSLAQPRGRVFAYHVDRWVAPSWWHEAVVYQIIVDRFSSARDEAPLLHHSADITGYFGGTLRGAQEQLGYIEQLGVNCVWLLPVFESPTYHGYDPSDYYHVAERYGGDEALVQFIQEAHRRNIRVMLDFIANHTSDRHALFLQAKDDPNSPYARWYDFSEGGYRSYAQVSSMPQLMTENPEVQRYLFDAACYWLEHFGADGLRLDHVPGPPHAFWTLLQKEIKEHHPQVITIGEISASLDEIGHYAGRLDAFMDFPLAGMLRRVFAARTASLAELFAYLEARKAQLPPGMERGTLLDNHDMHRFLWLAGGDRARLKLAAACHLTLEGTPIIYYGTEIGLSQYDDAHRENGFARPPMLWGEAQDQELLAYYRQLVRLRREHPALRLGERILLTADVSGADPEQVGAYVRRGQGEVLLVVLNNSEQEARVSVSLRVFAVASMQRLLPVHEEREVLLKDGVLEVSAPAMAAAIFYGEEMNR